ncbi:hypothetical protein EV360DRAFT_76057, partial [Lentinula raphanica]
VPDLQVQVEKNTLYEGAHAPPFYTDLYNFLDGAQIDIFQDSYIPDPSLVVAFPVVNQTVALGVNLPFVLSSNASSTLTSSTTESGFGSNTTEGSGTTVTDLEPGACITLTPANANNTRQSLDLDDEPRWK